MFILLPTNRFVFGKPRVFGLKSLGFLGWIKRPFGLESRYQMLFAVADQITATHVFKGFT